MNLKMARMYLVISNEELTDNFCTGNYLPIGFVPSQNLGDENNFAGVWNRVEAKDSQPDRVCKNCENTVGQFYVFRENCLNAYYGLLNHRNSYNGEAYRCEGDPILERNDDTNCRIFQDIKLEVQEEPAQVQDSLNLPESYVVCTDHPCAETHSEQKFIPDTNSESTFGGLSPQSRPTREFDDGLTSVSPEPDDYLEKIENVSNDLSNCQVFQEKEKLPSQIAVSKKPLEIVKFKCFTCRQLFPSLDVAANHSAQCPSSGNIELDERSAEAAQFPDENAQKDLEESAKIEELVERETNELFINPGHKSEPCTKSHPQEIVNQQNLEPPSEKPAVIPPKPETSATKWFHSCKYCDVVFSSAALLRRHAVVHTCVRVFECPICKEHFLQIGRLNYHMKSHKKTWYRCDVCNTTFSHASVLKEHMSIHADKESYICNICCKLFPNLSTLRRHKKEHTGRTSYTCEICGEVFCRKASIIRHRTIHEGGTILHPCNLCGRSFADIEEMKLHRNGHDGYKPRKCNYCKEFFRSRSELSEHTRRSHTFEKPYQCSLCPKGFYVRSGLDNHVKLHAQSKPYACSSCDRTFCQKDGLNRHRMKKHSKDKDIEVSAGNEISGLANDSSANTNDSLIAKQEENVAVETMEENIG